MYQKAVTMFYIYHLTKIWEMSRYVFVRLLLGHLWTYGRQTWQGGRGWARKKSGKVRFYGNLFVAMLTRKFSHGQDIGARAPIFCMSCNLHLSNLLAKNEQNLPCSSGDRSPTVYGQSKAAPLQFPLTLWYCCCPETFPGQPDDVMTSVTRRLTLGHNWGGPLNVKGT